MRMIGKRKKISSSSFFMKVSIIFVLNPQVLLFFLFFVSFETTKNLLELNKLKKFSIKLNKKFICMNYLLSIIDSSLWIIS